MTLPIEKLPNIGRVLGERLRSVGIATQEDLLGAGDAEAFARIRQTLPDDACRHTRLALAGAVRGVRYSTLPAEFKAQVVKDLG